MRNAFADTFYDCAKADERLAMVVADISPAGAMERFRQDFPRRFVNTGVAEQIMIGMVAGMAMRGLKPFAYTIATFALFRPYEFIRCDLAFQNLPVTVVGVGGGVTYSQLGGTHHAMEDVSVACAMPGMRVIAPCDPLEAAAAARWCAKQEDGPVYLRLGKAGEKSISEAAPKPWEFGKVRIIKPGREAIVLGYGPILKLALDATAGQDVAVASVHTLKPLDKDGLGTILLRYPLVVVLEEAVPRGTLGEAVRALAQEIGARTKIETLSLKDRFIHVYGSHADLLAAHGLTEGAIMERLNG